MSKKVLLTFTCEEEGMMINYEAAFTAFGVPEVLWPHLPRNTWSEEPEFALEHPYELEDCIEDVLQRMPKRQARIVRLSIGLSTGTECQPRTPEEISQLLSYPESGPKMGISVAEVERLIAEGKAMLRRDDRLKEARMAHVL